MTLRSAYTDFVRAAMNSTLQFRRGVAIDRKVPKVHVRG
jgi:hypothetical protein